MKRAEFNNLVVVVKNASERIRWFRSFVELKGTARQKAQIENVLAEALDDILDDIEGLSVYEVKDGSLVYHGFVPRRGREHHG